MTFAAGIRCVSTGQIDHHELEADTFIAAPTEVNVLLALLPSVVIAVTQTTMIKRGFPQPLK